MPTVYIGMGANLPGAAGSPEAALAAAAERLAKLGTVVARSHLYATQPVGITEQPDFVNAVVALETELQPRQLLAALHVIERDFGRNRSAETRNGPRTMDLDILFFGDAVVREPELEIPHPRLFQRAFVLIPLREIAPDLRDPRSGMSMKEWQGRLCSVPYHDKSAVLVLQSDLWRPGAQRNADRRGAE